MLGLYETTLAILLIMMPPGSAEPSQDFVNSFRPQLTNAAKILEIDLGYSDGSYLEDLRCRYEEVRSFPPLSDVTTFGISREQCQQARSAIFSMKDQIDTLKKLGGIRDDKADCLIKQLQLRYDAWDCLTDAHSPGFPSYSRRYWLNRLRQTIGDENYYNGHMPLPLP